MPNPYWTPPCCYPCSCTQHALPKHTQHKFRGQNCSKTPLRSDNSPCVFLCSARCYDSSVSLVRARAEEILDASDQPVCRQLICASRYHVFHHLASQYHLEFWHHTTILSQNRSSCKSQSTSIDASLLDSRWHRQPYRAQLSVLQLYGLTGCTR